jgi:glycosyltransferase involved in cell wall biosynthesis
MPVFSVVIPIKNEDEAQVFAVIENLVFGMKHDDIEIIIVNDGSINSDGTFRPINHQNIPWTNLKIIDNTKNFGVGYSFDRGVELAEGDILVLMGADIFTMHGWEKIKNLVKPNEIGCACSVGLNPQNYDINKKGAYRRYGADILYTMTVDDLPKKSELRRYPDHKDILESKWLPKKSDMPYEIPCAYGAFYWMTKEFYNKIGGWDTKENVRFSGHIAWGGLEAHLSLKARVYEGKCMMYPDIETGHIFAKIVDMSTVRSVRQDYKYWNKLWIAHTLLDDELRDKVINFIPPNRNINLARAHIRNNWAHVQEVREKNRREGKLISK